MERRGVERRGVAVFSRELRRQGAFAMRGSSRVSWQLALSRSAGVLARGGAEGGGGGGGGGGAGMGAPR